MTATHQLQCSHNTFRLRRTNKQKKSHRSTSNPEGSVWWREYVEQLLVSKWWSVVRPEAGAPQCWKLQPDPLYHSWDIGQQVFANCSSVCSLTLHYRPLPSEQNVNISEHRCKQTKVHAPVVIRHLADSRSHEIMHFWHAMTLLLIMFRLSCAKYAVGSTQFHAFSTSCRHWN